MVAAYSGHYLRRDSKQDIVVSCCTEETCGRLDVAGGDKAGTISAKGHQSDQDATQTLQLKRTSLHVVAKNQQDRGVREKRGVR